ncbi:hypothetical protein HYV88_02995 [Candidatus Woesearchaeota archaeon]|nr:hypothetical protein [Candidatus Woesearchaeota archaeon]
MRTKKLGLLRRLAIASGIGVGLFGSSCTSSGIERAIEQLITGDQPVPGFYVPNYPPYVPDEPLPTGNSPYPQRVVEWDDVDNVDELVDQTSTDSEWTTIEGSGRTNVVVNGFIVEYDHDLKDGGGDDIRLSLPNVYNQVYSTIQSEGPVSYGVYLVIPKKILFKGQVPKDLIGWEAYALFPIKEHSGYTISAIDMDLGTTIRNAGRTSNMLAVMNYNYNRLKVVSITDRHGSY